MRKGEVVWLLTLCGLPFAHFFNHKLDLWHVQALWMQVGLFALFAVQGLGPIPMRVRWWMTWVSLLTLGLWVGEIFTHKIYPLSLLMSASHCWLITLFIGLAASWNEQFLETLFLWLARMVLVLVLYGWLQWLNLDQFFTQINTKDPTDQIVGTLGNPTHFSAWLGTVLPLLYHQRWRVGWGLAWGLILLMAMQYASVTGVVCACLSTLIWTWREDRPASGWVFLGMVGMGGWCWSHLLLFNPEGRLGVWKLFYGWFAHRPITGWGPGFVMQMSSTITTPDNPLFTWRHVHNEILQLGIEQGLIGVGLAAYAIGEALRWARSEHPQVSVCLAMGLASFASAMTLFPYHLWQMGMLGLIAYCGLRVHGTHDLS